MANATGMNLATEAEKLAQEALKKKKQEEEALLNAYSTNAMGLYDGSKDAASGYLSGAKSDIQGLYDQGYKNIEDLSGQESAATMKDLVRQNENKLNAQGLLTGPSGALNEALAGAAERVRVSQLSKLEDYINAKNSALSSVFSNTASQQSALEQAYANQQQGVLATALQTRLNNAEQGAALTDKYTSTGLEAALGSNKISVETAAQKDLAQQQSDLAAALQATQQATKDAALKTQQDAWDREYQSIYANLYRSYRQTGMMDSQAVEYAKRDAIKQVGPRPA